MQVLVIIPAYNEAGHVGEVVRRVREQGHSCLIIDDGSTDTTRDVALAAGADVVTHRNNLGLGRAIRRGYEEALARGADIIVQLDADGQYDPAEIPKLLAPLQAGQADMVLGSRLDDLQMPMPWLNRVGNRAFSSVLRGLTKADIRDGQTGFRAMHRVVLERASPINEFTYTQEMVIRVVKEGFRVVSVPVKFYPRYDGRSRLFRSPLRYAARGWWIIIRTWRDYHPFKFFFWPGMVSLVGAMVAAGFVLDHFLATGLVTGRLGTLVVAGVLFLFGMQLLFLGLLADMIRTHSRP